MEARIVERDEALAQEIVHAAKTKTWLAQTKDILCLANEKVKAAKEQAASTTIRAIEEYKVLDDFQNDATEVGRDAYLVEFIDYRDKVAKAYLAFILRTIWCLEKRKEEQKKEKRMKKRLSPNIRG